ncbi:hypothetical protein F5Y17DRAFT_435225 [Xylariaceae sp. FL0594]|nr:hypothetical protein F5Y17DRAFT_435225 [Xylariaceae sp. FL0594]
MQYSTAVFALLSLFSASASLAAPTTNTPAAATGFALPSLIRAHNVTSNANSGVEGSESVPALSTFRRARDEMTTLFDIPIPASAAGRTCALVIKASPPFDVVYDGTKLDIFANGFTDLAVLTQGNLRDRQLARVVFNAHTNVFDFLRADFVPTIDAFPCPAGKTLHWEAVSVGEDVFTFIAQASVVLGSEVPEGLSVAWF